MYIFPIRIRPGLTGPIHLCSVRLIRGFFFVLLFWKCCTVDIAVVVVNFAALLCSLQNGVCIRIYNGVRIFHIDCHEMWDLLHIYLLFGIYLFLFAQHFFSSSYTLFFYTLPVPPRVQQQNGNICLIQRMYLKANVTSDVTIAKYQTCNPFQIEIIPEDFIFLFFPHSFHLFFYHVFADVFWMIWTQLE